MSLKQTLSDLVNSIAEKTNDLNNVTEKKANKRQDLTSSNGDHYPSVPAVQAGIQGAVTEAQRYADAAVSDVTGQLGDYITKAQKGAPGGVADLDGDGRVPASQLPSYVDDVREVASLPATGESGVIYVTTNDNLTYRWSGTGFIEISKSIALGETASTAYRGDRGKIAYDHTTRKDNPHGVTKAQVGLGNVDNTSDASKPVSTAQAAAIAAVRNDLEDFQDEVGTDFPDYNMQYLNAINYGNL